MVGDYVDIENVKMFLNVGGFNVDGEYVTDYKKYGVFA